MDSGLVAIAVNAVDIAALATGIGVLACRLWLLNPCDQRLFLKRLNCLLTACVALLGVTTAALLVLRAQVLSGGDYKALAAVLPSVLLSTHFGHIWLLRGTVIGTLWLLWWLDRRAGVQRYWPVLMLIATAVLAFTRSATGHAADAGDFTVPETVDWLHLLAISLWAGGVLAAALSVFPAAPERRGPLVPLAGFAHRLSRLATVALAAVILTGTYQAWDRLQHTADLWQTSYGRHLLLKLVLVLVMIGLGAFNRFFHLPGLIADHNRPTTTRRFARVIYFEAGIALLVTLATAALIQAPLPPHHAASLSDFLACTVSGQCTWSGSSMAWQDMP